MWCSRLALSSTRGFLAAALLVLAAAGSPVGAANSNLHLGKTVTGASDAPVLGLTLGVDRSAAIPKDTLTYTAVVSNTGSVLSMAGDLTVQNTDATTATIASYFDAVATTAISHCGAGSPNDGQDTSQWAPLAGSAAATDGYTPVQASPVGSGLRLTATPVPAAGVVYPASGDPILGTQIAPGAQATWHYTATITLTPAQTAFLLDPARVTRIRNTFHAEPVPRDQGGQGSPATINVDFCQQLFSASPSGTVSNVTVTVTPPAGAAPVTLGPAAYPGLASLAPGASVTVTVPSVIPFTGGRQAGESDAGYLARLATIEGSRLVGTATAAGTGTYGPVSAPPATSTPTLEHLPIVKIVKSGPATADAGTTASYPLALTNSGGATASGLSVADSVAGGGTGTVTGVPASLGSGGSATASASFAIPSSQPDGPLTDSAAVTWRDANGDLYGPVASSFTTQVRAVSTTPVATVSSGPVEGNFFFKSGTQTFFGARPGDTPAFHQTFPTIDFNPPDGVINHNVSGVGPTTRPFTDVTTDGVGNFAGTIVAQGNGLQAGVGTLSSFDAVFTASFVVAKAGDVTFNVLANDGFLLGIGGGATRVSGVYENAPASNQSPFQGYPLVGSWNQSSGGSVGTYPVTVHFPAPGVYPYELDYFDCCGQPLSLTLAVAKFNEDTQPLSVYVGYADGLRPAGSIFPFPWQGSPNVSFYGSGATAFDAGAIRFDNNSDTPIVFEDVAVDIGPFRWDLWGNHIVVPPHGIAILTQTNGENFDTSDAPITCRPTGYIPKIHVTQAGVTTTYEDTQQILNTKGIDPANCGGGNESHAWERIGGGGAAINVPLPPAVTLSLSPSTSPGKTVGSAQTLSLAVLDIAGQPVPNLEVEFGVFGANTQTLHATTDASGVATTSYTGLVAGNDTITATAFVSGLRAVSNALSISWTIPVPGGGGGGTGGGTGGTPQQAPPVIAPPSPADGTIVTKPIDVTTTMTAPDGTSIASWSVTAAGAHGGTITLASGTGAPPATLAVFDPSVVPNDTYTITVSGTTTAGGVQTASTSVVVQGNLKPGRYITTYQDAVLPVDGFQIGLRRVYDSIDRAPRELGFNWHLSLADFRVTANRPLGAGGWSAAPSRCSLFFCEYAYKTTAPHFVTVTYPDGRQEIFDFTPAGGIGPFYWLGTAAFTARPGTGTTSTLEVEGDNSVMYNFDGTLHYFAGDVYNPTRFVLTTQAKQVLHLDAATGLVSEADRNGNTVTIDAAGIHASNGASIDFSRDAAGRISAATLPGGHAIQYAYTPSGDLGSVTYPNGTVIAHTYDSDHLLQGSSGNGGTAFSQQRYDDEGRLVEIIDGEGHSTRIDNDLAGQRQIITSPSGRLTTIDTFDDRGDVIREDRIGDGRTITSTYTYDALGRLLSATDPLGNTTSRTYDENGHVLTSTDFAGNTTRFTYTPEGLVQSQIQPDGTTVSFLTYDTRGNVVTERRADGSEIHRTYDAQGRIASKTDASGRTLTYAYDAMGHLASITDPLGKVSRVSIDADGLVTSISDPLGGTTSMSYDADGKLLAITDVLGNTSRYTYDAYDNVTSVTDPFGAVETNVYDNAGRLISHVHRTGETTAYAYDADGHLISKTLPGNDVTSFSYNSFGSMASATNSSARLTFDYDDAGNLRTITSSGTPTSPQPSVTHSYTYDPAGQRRSVSGPAGTVRYGFDENRRLRTVTDPANGVFQLGYDALNRIVSLSRPNGVADTLTYTPSNELLSRESILGSLLVSRAVYDYDNFGRRTSRTDVNGTSTFAYDDLGQLLSATYPAGIGLTDESYSYDLAGNRTSSAGTPPGAWVYDRNRLMQDGSATYTYDAEGNQITRTDRATGGVTRYTWDAEHQLTGVRFPDGSSETFRYDPLGRRIEIAHGSQATRYSYDGPSIDAEYDAANALVATYLHGPTADAILESTRGSQRFYHHLDGLGSVTAITNQTGNVVARYVYDAFGNQRVTGSAANPFTFTGREFDAATGLYYYRLRTYDPRIGRFLSEDPLPSTNPYPYVSNNPVNLIDPWGAEAEEYAALNQLEAAESSAVACVRNLAVTLLKETATQLLTIYAIQQVEGSLPYVGRTGRTTEIRFSEHLRTDRFAAGLEEIGQFSIEIPQLEDAKDTERLIRVIEQMTIEEFGGTTQLLNARNEINAKDYSKYRKIFCGK
jgi:RHS repeat-associated protein